jgi:hypothetical protein
LALVGDNQILHTKMALAVGRVLLDVQEVGTIRRQN